MQKNIFENLKKISLQLRTEELPETVAKLKKLEAAILQNTEAIATALHQDFSKPRAEALMTEIYPVIKEIQFALKNLKKWRKAQKVSTPIALIGNKSFILHEPRGVCLIISPWNYPFNLCLSPLVSAIAARNAVVLKPSEYTPRTNEIIKKIIGEVFLNGQVVMQGGGPEDTQGLLQLSFDHVFFTGSTSVGKIIMEAASKHLSSVTLELGGKSPTIVDKECDLEKAAEKIVWAKFLNAGQTCVAPDYILVHHERQAEFQRLVTNKIRSGYGQRQDLCQIISVKHTLRLETLLKDAIARGAKLVCGGHLEVSNRFVAPTVIENVEWDAQIMKEEIFGPILPIISYEDLDEALEFINRGDKPLALYIYSNNQDHVEMVLQKTSAGGVCHNNSIVHLGNPHLPFGGVGPSGVGNYHGHYGFKAFSHEKAFLKEVWPLGFLKKTFPPYTVKKVKLIEFLLSWF